MMNPTDVVRKASLGQLVYLVIEEGAKAAIGGCVGGFLGKLNVGPSALIYSTYSMADLAMKFTVVRFLGNSVNSKAIRQFSSLTFSTLAIIAARRFAGMGNLGTAVFGGFALLSFLTEMNAIFNPPRTATQI